jgi:hypothetical protein
LRSEPSGDVQHLAHLCTKKVPFWGVAAMGGMEMPADVWAGVLKDLISAAVSRGMPQAIQLRDVMGQAHCSESRLASHRRESSFM